MKTKFLTLLLISCGFCDLSLAQANGPVVTVYNDNTTEVYASIRANDAQPGNNCLPEVLIFPGNSKAFNRQDLQENCKSAQAFLVDAFGKTHTIRHTKLATKIPTTCKISHIPFNIKLACN